MAQRRQNRCDYVIRRAGETYDGRPLSMDGHGDVTQTCPNFGRKVPYTYFVKVLGTTAVYEPREGTAIRCSEHTTRR